MTDLISVTVADGKYTIEQTAAGQWQALRYGDAWAAFANKSPDNLHVALAYEVHRLRTMVPSELLGYEAPAITDEEGHLLEAALQAGAHMLNDDGTVYAFTQENLLRLMKCAIAGDFLSLWEKPSPAEAPLTATGLADALDAFWNAALSEARGRDCGNTFATASAMAVGFAAVAAELRNIKTAGA
jgi:hypothetical protein